MDQCYCWLLLYAKMLKETETEETVVFFVTFISLVTFQLGDTPMLSTGLELQYFLREL